MNIQDGRYKARAIEWKLGLTSQGKEQIGVLFQLEDGQTITWYGYFTEKTTERTLDSLDHMGWDGGDISKPLVGLDANEVMLVIENEKNDDGKIYPRVRWVNRIGGGLAMKEELTGNALQNFKQRMQGEILARKQNKPAQKSAPKPAQVRAPSNGYSSADYAEDGSELPF
jgi:hypothetical protein